METLSEARSGPRAGRQPEPDVAGEVMAGALAPEADRVEGLLQIRLLAESLRSMPGNPSAEMLGDEAADRPVRGDVLALNVSEELDLRDLGHWGLPPVKIPEGALTRPPGTKALPAPQLRKMTTIQIVRG
jgi:hypothetical protein